ncbi:hypothetical protein R5R35_008559 [Gryllus longicercus]|uniref:Uncharacterized protein n=1 Tax=Gryllus longicercus TaxID=2509291 RepID=A0AAN9Z2X0_9ORTH
MKFVALCALALAAWACVGVRAEDDNPDRHVSCFPCRDEDRATTVCPVVRPSQSRSGKLTRCGCCDTCLVYLADGDICDTFIPTNTLCKSPMRCIWNVCRSVQA